MFFPDTESTAMHLSNKTGNSKFEAMTVFSKKTFFFYTQPFIKANKLVISHEDFAQFLYSRINSTIFYH